MMVIRTLYYVYMSLYASSNAVTGLYMIGDFVYMPIADMRNLANLVTGIIALSIGIACFVGLYVRRATDNKTLLVRKRLKELLAYVLLPPW